MGKSLIASGKTSIVLLTVYALVLATATFIEKYRGTEMAKLIVYYSPVFLFFQFLLVVNFIAVARRRRLFRKRNRGFMLVHGALILVLAGALTTRLFGKEGIVHLREGESSRSMLVRSNQGDRLHALPFRLELKKFTLARYPGSFSPSAFESEVIVYADNQSFEQKISMNKVLDFQGYRFFQASYDKDEKGSVLSVNRDVTGRRITYTGYALLVTGFIFCLADKNSRFRQLIRRLKQLQLSQTALLAFCFLPLSLQAQSFSSSEKTVEIFRENKIDPEHAARFGALPVQSPDGRLEPLNTFASEILRKLHRSDKIDNLDPNQFLIRLLAFPEKSMHIPLIRLPNKAIAPRYGLSENDCAYIELFDAAGNYKLINDLENIYAKPPAQRSRFEKDLLKLDEQINLFYRLIHREIPAILPDKKAVDHSWKASGDLMDEYIVRVRQGMQTGSWEAANQTLESIRSYQEKNSTIAIDTPKIRAELLYNQLNIFRLCKKLYLIAGGLLLVLSFFFLFRKQQGIKRGVRLLSIAVSLPLLYHLFGIILRWYIGGYAPWSNAYETMIYVSFITGLAGMFFARRSAVTLALSVLFAGVILFVAGLNWMDPQITPLVPVLQSPWLMIHVAVIVAAYGFFGIGFLLGTTNLLLSAANKNAKLTFYINELSLINEIVLWMGLALMTCGTFFGAVWANESWGRYWGWDPKETWALITIMVYAAITHRHLIKKEESPLLFNLLSVIAFACVLMTYFGVNYFLSGMHSYN